MNMPLATSSAPAPESRPGGLAVAFADGVATIWLDRPAKLNALARDFWPAMRALLDEIVARGDCGAIVLTGSGPRAFCAGGDIASFDALDGEAERRAFQIDCMDTFLALEQVPLPVIAAVNGLALGGGCELTMACDMALAADTAEFGMPEANLGLVPGYGILRAPSVIGRQWANWMITGCQRVTAAQALAIGLVQRVAPSDQLLDTATALARDIAQRSRDGNAVAKTLLGGGTAPDRVDASVAAITRLHGTPDGAEGRRAFLERRPPRFN